MYKATCNLTKFHAKRLAKQITQQKVVKKVSVNNEMS